MPKLNMAMTTCLVSEEEYSKFIDTFHIPSCYDLVRPDSHHMALDVSLGYVVLYMSLFTVGNFRLLFNDFFLEVLDFFKCHLSLLNPFGDARLSSFAVAYRAYGGEPTLPLFSIPGWKSKFIFVREGLFSEQHYGLVTSFRHGLGTFSVPLPSEPFDVILRYDFERLSSLSEEDVGSHGIPDVDLYEEHVEMQAAGSADVDVDIISPRAYNTSVTARVVQRRVMPTPALANPSFKGKEVMASPSEETREIDPFLPGFSWLLSGLLHPETQRRLDGLTLNELANFHDVSALRFVMSNNMLNREARSLSMEVSRLRDKVVTLRNQRADSAIVISRLEAKLLGVEGRLAASEDFVVRDLKAENEKLIIEDDTESLYSRCRQFEEKEAVMLATEASLKAELEILKEKLDLANEDRSLMVTNLLLHAVKALLSSDSFGVVLASLQEKDMFVSRGQALKEVANMGIRLRLEDMKDYKSDVEETYDKAIYDFYRVEFPYLDLLA
ncbi:hypothetical protein Tco_0966824 [Tanacetum coccineum]